MTRIASFLDPAAHRVVARLVRGRTEGQD